MNSAVAAARNARAAAVRAAAFGGKAWRTPLSSAAAPNAEAQESSAYPAERFGFQYSTNWALAAAGIQASPDTTAHSNLSGRRYLKFAEKPALALPKAGGATFLTAGFTRPSGTEVSFSHICEKNKIVVFFETKHI